MTHDDDDWDVDDADNDGYIECPHCGEEMLEAADYCPYCDRWISTGTAIRPVQPWPLWKVVLIAISIAMFFVIMFYRPH